MSNISIIIFIIFKNTAFVLIKPTIRFINSLALHQPKWLNLLIVVAKLKFSSSKLFGGAWIKLGSDWVQNGMVISKGKRGRSSEGNAKRVGDTTLHVQLFPDQEVISRVRCSWHSDYFKYLRRPQIIALPIKIDDDWYVILASNSRFDKNAFKNTTASYFILIFELIILIREYTWNFTQRIF